MDRNLIVNADDFGWTEAINEGVITAHTEGIVTSATLLATGRAADHAVQLARAAPGLGVGVHLSYERGGTFIDPRRLRTIFSPEGEPRFGPYSLWAAASLSGNVRRHLRDHFRSQVGWVLDRGISPTHLDTHRHMHMWPAIMRMVCEVAKEFSIPAVRLPAEPFASRFRVSFLVRMQLAGMVWTIPVNRAYIRSLGLKTTSQFVAVPVTGHWTKERLLAILETLPVGWTEVVVHPGRPGDPDDDAGQLIQSRATELGILIDPQVREVCQARGIRRVSYRDLAAEPVASPARLPA